MIFKAALAASRTNPAKWDWPAAATPEVRQQIIDGHHTREELRNIYSMLARFSGDRWPSSGPRPANRAMDSLNAPNAVSHGRGFRELEVFYGSNGYGGVADRVNRVDTLIAHGDRVFVSWVIDGHHTGKLFGFPGDGKKLNVRESNLTTFKDGKVVEADGHGDDYALYIQAGGKVSFPDTTPRAEGPARGAGAAGQPGPSKGDLILQAAAAASKTDPAKWDWPAAASPQVRQQIIDGHYSREELGNIYMVLARSSGDLWPSSGPPPANRSMDSLNWPGAVFHGHGFKGLEESFGSNGYGGISQRVNKVDTLIAHGDRVYLSWIIDGRHTGKLFGFPGDGKQINVRESSMLRLTRGRIVEGDYNGDDLALYTQAGGKISFPDKTS